VEAGTGEVAGGDGPSCGSERIERAALTRGERICGGAQPCGDRRRIVVERCANVHACVTSPGVRQCGSRAE
jgi:hypothetical protein